MAIDIPLFAASWAHWNVASGRGMFGVRAAGALARSATRLMFIGACVLMGLSVFGAVLATIAASVVELALGAPLEDIGVYAIAQTLCILPPLVAMAVGPSLLGVSARLRADGQVDAASRLEREALGMVAWLIPVAVFTAAATQPIVTGFFGAAYNDAAALLTILMIAAVAQAFAAVGGAILTASDRLKTVLLITTGLVGVALAGHLFAIPRWGSHGAALVTLAVSMAAACAMVAVLRVSLGVTPRLFIPEALRLRWSHRLAQRGESA